MSLISWFKRLIGLQPKPRRPVSGTGSFSPEDLLRGIRPQEQSAVSRLSSFSAEDLLRRVLELQRANADWVAIFASVNPENDHQVQSILTDVKGPHMFAPHLGLSVLEDGCRRVMASDPSADRLAALRAAKKSMERFT